MNQQPPMHQLTMSPLKPFWGWTKNTSSLLVSIVFFRLFSAPKFSSPTYLPPTYLHPPIYISPFLPPTYLPPRTCHLLLLTLSLELGSNRVWVEGEALLEPDCLPLLELEHLPLLELECLPLLELECLKRDPRKTQSGSLR
jgi:hypothetical protein